MVGYHFQLTSSDPQQSQPAGNYKLSFLSTFTARSKSST